MARALGLGEAGRTFVSRESENVYRARCRFRQPDGRVVEIEQTGRNDRAARASLRAELDRRRVVGPAELSKRSARVSEAIRVYSDRLARQERDGAIRATTRRRYADCLPRLDSLMGSLRISEISTGQIARVMNALADEGLSPSSRRLHRAVIAGILGMLAEYDVISGDMTSGLRRITGDRKPPRALTLPERSRLLDYCDSDALAQKRGLGDIVRFMLGTGARIGEALAIRWQDVELDGVPVNNGDVIEMVPVVAITGNIVEVTGRGIVRHDGKTEASRRVVPLPHFVVAMLRRRRVECDRVPAPGAPVFGTVGRDGTVTYRRPSDVQRWIRQARAATGLDWATSHTFRKTAATILHDAGLTDRAVAAITGHASLSVLTDVYIGRGSLNPAAAAALESANPTESTG